jgi:hypothetical protein
MKETPAQQAFPAIANRDRGSGELLRLAVPGAQRAGSGQSKQS